METPTCLRLYDTATAVDAMLSGRRVPSELRWWGPEGQIYRQQQYTSWKRLVGGADVIDKDRGDLVLQEFMEQALPQRIDRLSEA